MINKQTSNLKLFNTCLICIIVWLAALPAIAQEAEAVQARSAEAVDAVKGESVKVKQKVRFQKTRAPEGDNLAKLRADLEQCGTACSVGGADSIAAGGGGTRDHECDDDGNCHCFGAIDCVAMSKICAPDTIGCNDQGCLCKEGEGDGGG